MKAAIFVLLAACAPATLSASQRMELIERLDQSAAFAKKCGLGRAEMRVRFIAMPDGTIAEPLVVAGGSAGTPEKLACVVAQLKSAKLSPHAGGLVVRTERLLPTGRARTDDKLLADQRGLTPEYIDKVVASADVQSCGKAGDLTVFFLIDPQGSVSDVFVETAIGQPKVEWCVLDAFKALHFDAPADGGYVEVARTINLAGARETR